MPSTVWKGFISFGLVSFPVQLFSAARADSVHFNMLHGKDQSRVRQVWYCVEEDKQIERSEMVKGYEVGKGEYVVIEDAELKKIAPPTATTMDILQFVGTEEVDPIYYERSYYLSPDEKASKPYGLFLAALKETQQHAIAKLAMHNREHVVLIRPSNGGLVLHTLYYQQELNESNKSAAPEAKHTDKELELAKTLVTQLAAPFQPEEFQDTYRENVERLIEEKQSGRQISIVKQPSKAPVIDLMEALKRSLESAKPSRKPAAKATRKTATPRKASGKHRAA
ncbi:MAG TPA: Ku protein [Bryobacteraceae bacterium]|jgi:DNA end-binding protein Ku|nr:Ku protein [Bryobacteraceae bacterium]